MFSLAVYTKMQTFWRHARVKLRPPAPSGDWPLIQKGFAELIRATKNLYYWWEVLQLDAISLHELTTICDESRGAV